MLLCELYWLNELSKLAPLVRTAHYSWCNIRIVYITENETGPETSELVYNS